MKRILILIIGLIGVAYGQSSPTSAKTRFVNGLYVGTKLDAYFAAADSNALYWRADSVVMAKYKGTARALAFAVSGGYLPILDTAAMLSGYKTYYPRTAISAGTGISYNPATGVITNSSPSSGGTVTSVATNNGSGITGGTITSTGTIAADTTILSTKANVTGLLVGYATTGNLALKLNISDTATMLSNYRRTSTRIENSDLRFSTISGVSLGASLFGLSTGYGLNGSGYDGGAIRTWEADTNAVSTKANVVALLLGYATNANLATKLNISDTATMLSNYRRKTTLIENADLRNSAITINGSSTSLGGSISVGTVTSVAASAGTGISVSGSPITTSGTLTITNTAPDQTVTLTAGSGISVTGTYPNFTVANTSPSSGGTVTSVSAGTGMSFTTITSSGAVNADTTTLATRAYVVGLDVGKANTSLNNVNGVLSSTYGGAGIINGILKADGSGVVSPVIASDITTLISGTYLPLSGGTLTGALSGTSAAFSGAGSFGGTISSTDGIIQTILSYGTGIGSVGTNTNHPLVFVANSSEMARLVPSTGAFSVGGAGVPQGTLHVGNANSAVIINESSSIAQVVGTNRAGNASSGLFLKGFPLTFTGNGGGSAEQMRLTSAGNLLIKTTTDNGTDALQVAGSGLFNLTSSGTVLNLTRDGGTNGGLTVSFPSQQATFNSTVSDINFQTLGTERLKIAASTGAITASSSVTANSFVTTGSVRTTNPSDASYFGLFSNDGAMVFDAYGVGAFSSFKVNGTSVLSVDASGAVINGTSRANGYRFAYSTKSSNYTLTDNDDYVVVTNTSTVTLPTAVGRAGKRYVLRSTVGSGVSSSLTTTSGQTIDGIIGPFSFGFGNYNILIVFSDGANWFSETFITGG